MATSASSRAWTRLRRNKIACLSAGVIVFLMMAGIFGPIIMGEGPNVISRQTFVPPSLSHPLGTDELGRNVLTQLLYGIRTSLTVGMLAATSAAFIGITVGA